MVFSEQPSDQTGDKKESSISETESEPQVSEAYQQDVAGVLKELEGERFQEEREFYEDRNLWGYVLGDLIFQGAENQLFKQSKQYASMPHNEGSEERRDRENEEYFVLAKNLFFGMSLRDALMKNENNISHFQHLSKNSDYRYYHSEESMRGLPISKREENEAKKHKFEEAIEGGKLVSCAVQESYSKWKEQYLIDLERSKGNEARIQDAREMLENLERTLPIALQRAEEIEKELADRK
jgi:hypothetical protein